MLRSCFLTGICLLLLVPAVPPQGQVSPSIRQLTFTGEEMLTLNPSLSGDGRFFAFESSADLAAAGVQGFHALRGDLLSEPPALAQMAVSRAVAPAISQDGSAIAFASYENPLGTNDDGNSEIFLYREQALTQITNTTADESSSRLVQGNVLPSVSDDGRYVVFTSNRDLTNQNSDGNGEVFTYDSIQGFLTQLTDTHDFCAATAKISGDGNTIAFIRAAGTNRELLLLSRESNELPRTVAHGGADLTLAYGRAISDDGLRVVYASETAPHSSQLFLWDGRNNLTRQLTQLGVREEDVALQGTISGDGKRVSFATRRDLLGGNSDNSVELYLLDIPSVQASVITTAPAGATADVVSSLNDDGSLVVFSFPRVLSGAVTASTFANNSELYLAHLLQRPAFGQLSVANGAAATTSESIAPSSIAIARGEALAHLSTEARRQAGNAFPFSLAGTTVTVNGRNAQLFFVSPTQINFCVPPGIELGSAEVIATNADGYQSRGSFLVSNAAPSVFTIEPGAEAVALNADTLQRGPFDPSNGNLRLTLFATGVRNAASVRVTAFGHEIPVESVNASPDLPGLDEIHVSVPTTFRGVGTSQLIVTADNINSNPVEVTFSGASERDVVINEVLADPPDGLSGDANHDGVRSSSEDEFVEIVNRGTAINLSGWTVRTRGIGSTSETVRHTFPSGSFLVGSEVVVLFGGGTVDPALPIFGCTRVARVSSAGLNLINGGLTIVIRDAGLNLIDELTYGGTTDLEGDNNQSLTRSPDLVGAFVQHTLALNAEGRRFSPGLKADGLPLLECAGHLAAITLTPASVALGVGESTQIVAQPVDNFGRALQGLAVSFASDNPGVATVSTVTIDEVSGAVAAVINSHAPGVAHVTAETTDAPITVSTAATVTVSPPPVTQFLVITQIYGGGNNAGASFQNDFVELFNRGTSRVDFSLTPYSIQYASGAGNFSSGNKLNLTSGALAPGQYFLVHLAGGPANGLALPPPDASGAINLSATSGKVALVLGTNLIPGSGCPLDALVADFIGYGTANCAEGSPVGSLNATRTARRISSCVDANSNATDFSVITNPPPPRNSINAIEPCGSSLAATSAIRKLLLGVRKGP